MRFSIICATRGRPDNLSRMIESATKTAAHPESIEIILRMDDDDPATLAVLAAYANHIPAVSVFIGPRYRGYLDIGKLMNEVAPHATGDYLMMGDDDTLFISQDWDDIFYEAGKKYADKIVCLAAFSKKEPGSLTTCVSRRWYEAVGFFVSPNFPHPDSCLHEIARKVERFIIIDNVNIEHDWVGYSNPNDRTFQEGLQGKTDAAFWSNEAEQERFQAAKRLREAFGT